MLEHSEVLGLDAMDTGGPTILAVLGTRSAISDPQAFYRAREKVQRALKRRWPLVQYAALCEFTTGKGERSGGKRRPHWNLMLKGIPVEDVAQAADVIRSVWCSRVDALPAYQNIEPVRDRGGIFKYLAKHFGKEEQAPPAGWAGHRFLHSRGYFPTGIKDVRERARAQLARGRAQWHVEQMAPEHFTAEDKADMAAELYQRNQAHSWELAQVYELAGTAPAPPRLHAIVLAAARQRGNVAPPNMVPVSPYALHGAVRRPE